MCVRGGGGGAIIPNLLAEVLLHIRLVFKAWSSTAIRLTSKVHASIRRHIKCPKCTSRPHGRNDGPAIQRSSMYFPLCSRWSVQVAAHGWSSLEPCSSVDVHANKCSVGRVLLVPIVQLCIVFELLNWRNFNRSVFNYQVQGEAN